MDPTFYEHLRHELRRLLEDEEAGVQPRNPELSQAVYAVLRKQEEEARQAAQSTQTT